MPPPDAQTRFNYEVAQAIEAYIAEIDKANFMFNMKVKMAVDAWTANPPEPKGTANADVHE